MNALTEKLFTLTIKVKRNPTHHKIKMVHITVKKMMDIAAGSDGVRSFNVWNGELVDWNRESANDCRWS